MKMKYKWKDACKDGQISEVNCYGMKIKINLENKIVFHFISLKM